jgi:hypothetical protein
MPTTSILPSLQRCSACTHNTAHLLWPWATLTYVQHMADMQPASHLARHPT